MSNVRILPVTVITIAAVMLVAATTEMAITGYAFAYNRNQATGAANDCGNGEILTNIGCQNIDSQIQGDENSVALASQQTFPSVTRESPTTEPPTPTGFTVAGAGTGSGDRITCPQGSGSPDQTFSVEFKVQSDGTTTSGTYTLSVKESFGERIIREGVLTFATTDGNTYSLSGRDNLLLCNDFEGNLSIGISGISGDCGDDVTIIYSDETSLATFTGNVECTLT
jgi:hypothetical protein